MVSEELALRKQLRRAGISPDAIVAVWPEWWSEEAEGSISAVTELRYTVARRLGLSPQSIFDDEPRFIWRGESKFKNLGTATENEAVILTSFSAAFGNILVAATPSSRSFDGTQTLTAGELREILLDNFHVVALDALLTFAWSVGIPVVQMRLFPLRHKRMQATAVRVRDRHAILVGRESKFQAQIAYIIAHELGHLMLGHLQTVAALLEMSDPLTIESTDEEEESADRFALELLTGDADVQVESNVTTFTATQLATAALKESERIRVDPGLLALCLGHATGRWRQAIGAQKLIPPGEQDIGAHLNDLAQIQLQWTELSLDNQDYVRRVLGMQL